MSLYAILVFILLVFLSFCSIALTVGAYVNWQLTLEYERNVEVYFNYADRASDAKTKSSYFNQYMEALEKYDLIQGCNAIYFCEQPNASLEKNYIVAKSLQNRLTELSLLDEKETAYQLGMTQMTENEFCWFPTGTFYQKYMLDRGGWGVAITPEYPTDLCN